MPIRPKGPRDSFGGSLRERILRRSPLGLWKGPKDSFGASPRISKQKRAKQEASPSAQIDTDADSTVKRGKKHFGYKGHIGQDVGSGLIRKRSFTSARAHDSQQKENLWSGDEQAVFGDSAYAMPRASLSQRSQGLLWRIPSGWGRSEGLLWSIPSDSKQSEKRAARQMDIYAKGIPSDYGILDKATRRGQLSSSKGPRDSFGGSLRDKQKKRNKKQSAIRCKVEHPFAYMKGKLNYRMAGAKNLLRNSLRFDMNCIMYNIMRANVLLR